MKFKSASVDQTRRRWDSGGGGGCRCDVNGYVYVFSGVHIFAYARILLKGHLPACSVWSSWISLYGAQKPLHTSSRRETQQSFQFVCFVIRSLDRKLRVHVALGLPENLLVVGESRMLIAFGEVNDFRFSVSTTLNQSMGCTLNQRRGSQGSRTWWEEGSQKSNLSACAHCTLLSMQRFAASLLRGSDSFGYFKSCGRKISKIFTRLYIGLQVWLMTSRQTEPEATLHTKKTKMWAKQGSNKGLLIYKMYYKAVFRLLYPPHSNEIAKLVTWAQNYPSPHYTFCNTFYCAYQRKFWPTDPNSFEYCAMSSSSGTESFDVRTFYKVRIKDTAPGQTPDRLHIRAPNKTLGTVVKLGIS